MATRRGEIEQLGGQLLAISFTPPEKAAAYLARHPLPFPVLVDSERQAYRAFDLGRTSWRQFLRPHVILGYLRLMVRGWLPTKTVEGEDIMQLGGHFVLDAARRLVFAYRSADATDRPTMKALVEAVRTAAGNVPL